MEDIAQKIIDAGETGLWEAIKRQCLERLEKQPDNVGLLYQLANVYRQSGRLEQAATVYAQLASIDDEDIYARKVTQICGNIHVRDRFPAGAREPGSFAVIEDFLSSDERSELLALFDEKLPDMRELDITYTSAHKKPKNCLDPSSRYQLGAYVTDDLSETFRHKILDRLPGFCKTLNIDSFPVGKQVWRLDYTPPGGFGKMHQDTGFYARLSFLYYFHRRPKKFKGGDLLFFDQNTEKQPIPDSFTRIRHDDNLLVAFKPDQFHQVTRVARLGPALSEKECRLALCGFIHADYG